MTVTMLFKWNIRINATKNPVEYMHCFFSSCDQWTDPSISKLLRRLSTGNESLKITPRKEWIVHSCADELETCDGSNLFQTCQMHALNFDTSDESRRLGVVGTNKRYTLWKWISYDLSEQKKQTMIGHVFIYLASRLKDW